MARHQHGPVRRFERMSRLKDYAVEKGRADPRGWKVVDADGSSIGNVKDLVIDTDRMTASYLEVELDNGIFDLRDEPRILVPITRAQRDGDHRRLVAPELSRSRVNALFEARAEHDANFWERWWNQDSREVRLNAPGDHLAADHEARLREEQARMQASRPTRPSALSDLGRSLEDVRPGEEVRIPIIREELVVERRPVQTGEQVVARAPDGDMPPRRRDE